MKKLLNNPWFSGSLALAAVLLVVDSVMDLSNFGSSQSYYDSSSDSDDVGDEAAGDDSLGLPSFDSAGVQALATQFATRNLFEPKKEPVPVSEGEAPEVEMSQATVRVKGIWIQNDIRYAIIDDRTLQSGQTIERVRVERIDDQGVWLSSTLNLSSPDFHFVKPGESWTYQYPKTNDNSRD